jgi:hypothetical protein
MTRDDRNERPGTAAGGNQSAADLEGQLDRLFEQISIERAPASLRRRLRRIPGEEQPRESWWKRLLAPPPGVVLVMPRQPSQEDVLLARQELAVAFSYIEQAGLATSREIQSVLDEGLRHPVKGNLSEHMPFTKLPYKEETS